MCARGVGEGLSLDQGRRVFGFPGAGVVGEIINAGQTGKGLVGCAEGEVVVGPLLVRVFGKNITCSTNMWQVLQRAGARIWLMRSMHRSGCMPASFEMRTNSNSHIVGGREVVSPSVSFMGQIACVLRVSR